MFVPLVINKSEQENTWGPKAGRLRDIINNLSPLEVNLKMQRLGKICDFSHHTTHRNIIRAEDDFRKVINKPDRNNNLANRRFAPVTTKTQNRQTQRVRANVSDRNRFMNQMKVQNIDRRRQMNTWAIEPTVEWELLEDIHLDGLSKLKLDYKYMEFTDLEWRGNLHYYLPQYDRILPKASIPLKRVVEGGDYVVPGVVEDDVLMERMDDDNVIVTATDQVMAALMAAQHSRVSWYIKAVKLQGKISLMKEENSGLDVFLVGETAKTPPSIEESVKINRPTDLAMEAAIINKNIGLQLVDDKIVASNKPPSFDIVTGVTDKAYRYRLIKIPGINCKNNDNNIYYSQPVGILCRATVDAAVVSNDTTQYVAIKAFNEYDYGGTSKPWRTQLINHKGSLFATENRNNSGKLARWVCSTMIAGCSTMRIAYVSRSNQLNNLSHEILMCQSYKTEELAAQIGICKESAWYALKLIIDAIRMKDDGEYYLVKNPAKGILHIYRPPSVDDD